MLSERDAGSHLQRSCSRNECLRWSVRVNTSRCYPRSGIDTIREKVKMFAQKKVTLPEGKHKIIILDEADRYSYPQPLLFQLVSRQLPSRPWEEQWSSTPLQPVSPLLVICPPKSLSPFRYSLCSFLKSTSQDVPFWDIQSSQTSRF